MVKKKKKKKNNNNIRLLSYPIFALCHALLGGRWYWYHPNGCLLVVYQYVPLSPSLSKNNTGKQMTHVPEEDRFPPVIVCIICLAFVEAGDGVGALSSHVSCGVFESIVLEASECMSSLFRWWFLFFVVG
jgi:hypothetical protein